MNIELLGQFSQRLLTLHGSQSHLRLECRRMVPAWSFAHRLSCSAAILAAVRQKRHLSNLSKNPEPALASWLWRPNTFANGIGPKMGQLVLHRSARRRAAAICAAALNEREA